MIGFADYRERYVSLYTDFGFWKIFGDEQNKELLISFLSSLFQGEQNVTDVQYLNDYAMFDICCLNDKGERFIVEMQQAYQRYYKDRSHYYSSFFIKERANYGVWNLKINGVYTVGILNFVFPENKYSSEYIHHDVELVDPAEYNKLFDKINHIYIELPKFNKKEDELETMFDKLMFVLRNLSNLKERPAALHESVFVRLFDQLEIAKLTPQEMNYYQGSLKHFRDYNNCFNTAKIEGFTEGMKKVIEYIKENGTKEELEKFRFEKALALIKLGETLDAIIKASGMPEDEVDKLKEYLKNNPLHPQLSI